MSHFFIYSGSPACHICESETRAKSVDHVRRWRLGPNRNIARTRSPSDRQWDIPRCNPMGDGQATRLGRVYGLGVYGGCLWRRGELRTVSIVIHLLMFRSHMLERSSTARPRSFNMTPKVFSTIYHLFSRPLDTTLSRLPLLRYRKTSPSLLPLPTRASLWVFDIDHYVSKRSSITPNLACRKVDED